MYLDVLMRVQEGTLTYETVTNVTVVCLYGTGPGVRNWVRELLGSGKFFTTASGRGSAYEGYAWE